MNIFVDNRTMSLEEALRSGKMNIDGILAKENKDGNRDVYIGIPEMRLNNL